MKLVRYGNVGTERPGLMDAEGILRDLGHVIPDVGPAQLAPDVLSQLAALDISNLPVVSGKPRLGCPVTGVSKFWGSD